MRRVGAIVAGLLLLLMPIAPASAHAQLIAMTPAAGSTVTVAPEHVVLHFGETMQPMGSTVVVLDPQGEQVQTDELRVQGTDITVGLNRLVLAGRYRVHYRVLSADGHVVTDGRDFTFAPTAAAAAATSAIATAPAADLDSAAAGNPWPGYAIGALLLGCLLFVALMLRRRR